MPRMKHIDVKHHFIREILEEGQVSIQKIKITENPANMMTKVVIVFKFNLCLDFINVLKSLKFGPCKAHWKTLPKIVL